MSKSNKINKKKQNQLKRKFQETQKETTQNEQSKQMEIEQPKEEEHERNKPIELTNQMYPIEETIQTELQTELTSLKITQFTQLQHVVYPHLSNGKNLIIESPPQKGITYLLLLKIFQMIKTFPELKEEDLVDETKGGPYIIIICGDNNEVEAMQYLIRSVVDINVTAWKGITGKQKETKTTQRKDPIILTTLSSLLNQLVNNPEFTCHNVQFVASTSMERYQSDELMNNFKKIFNRLPKCQILLQSHSQFEEKNISFVSDGMKFVFEENERMKQEIGYAFYEMKDRMNMIGTLVNQFKSKKIVLLFASPAEVIFYEDILNQLEIHECLILHALMSIEEQTNAITTFKSMKSGVLLTTQERIIPSVDMAIHIDIPKELYNVYYPSTKQIILMVQKHENAFIELLKIKRQTKEYTFSPSTMIKIQDKVTKMVSKQYYVHLEAREAYQKFIQSYNRLDINLFSVKQLNLIEVANSFGLENPTKVNLDISGPQNVSDTPYEYKRKIFIGKDAYIPSIGKRNKIVKRSQKK